MLFFVFSTGLSAQVSHGGRPLPFNIVASKASDLFVTLPAFNLAEQLTIDSLNASDLRSSYQFAYKFITDYSIANSGIRFTAADGTRVWRLGIRSAGALSLNVLFTRYHLPSGARVFLYNPSQSEVLGAFTAENNSERAILPVSPVEGSELVIEYQEPANAPFHGELTVGEVNHGYRDFKASLSGEIAAYTCMPAALCFQDTTDGLDDILHSVLLLIIDGTYLCTGTLINNTARNGYPYLLLASHCLNGQFTITNPDYEKIAGTIVAYFNYNSPLCSPVRKGTQNMTQASAHFRAVNEKTDMALLELEATPPIWYQPYYSGWNAVDKGKPPYTGIHHPGGSVKRINVSNSELTYTKYVISEKLSFADSAHLYVKSWDIGSTAGGSSGSPLFDSNLHVVGVLTGGNSVCGAPYSDFYYSLARSWYTPSDSTSLKSWLNPLATDSIPVVCDGMDPYTVSSALRLSNVREYGITDSVELRLAGSTKTYAELYPIAGEAKVLGTYLVYQPDTLDANVEVSVYSGDVNNVTTLLCDTIILGSYWHKEIMETFLPFPTPPKVNNSFIIGYRVLNGGVNFAVCNLKKGATANNTLLQRIGTKWATGATDFSSSIYLDPVIRYAVPVSSEETPESADKARFIVGAYHRTLGVVLPINARQASFSMFSADGRQLLNAHFSGTGKTFTLGTVRPGVYIVSVEFDGKRSSEKVLF